MSRADYFTIATGVGAVIVAILPIPKNVAYPIAGSLVVLFIFLICKGLALKPAKQAETSKGLFVIDIVRYTINQSQNNRILNVSVLLHVMPSRRVESLRLQLLHHLINADWEPITIGDNVLTDGADINFDIPDSIKPGKYTIKLIAYSNGERFEFNPFEIEIPN